MADLDHDGIQDVVSGDFFGHVHWFAGQPEGGFKAGVRLLGSDGEILDAGDATCPVPFDVDRDGRLDLVIGNMDGDLLWAPQLAPPSLLEAPEAGGLPADRTPRFGALAPLLAGGQPIASDRGDAAPAFGDWDLDGDPDLLFGAQDGSVRWFENLGGDGALTLAPGRVLIEGLAWGEHGEGRSDKRVKPALFDWNQDGWPDLVVGDYTVLDGPPTDPEAAQAARAVQEAADRGLEPWQARERQRAEGLLAAWRAQAQGHPFDEVRARQAAYRQATQELERDPAYRAAMAVHLAAQENYSLVDTRLDDRGFLWVYLRRPPAEPPAK